VSPDDAFIYEYDWTPDGQGFIATSARGNGDNNWWVAKLAHIDAGSGALRIVASPATQLNMPRVSPDGRTVAFIGGLMSDFGSVGGDIYTVPLAGGEPLNLTPGFKGSFNTLAWRGKGLLGTALMGDKSAVLALDLAGRSTVLRALAASTGAAEGRMSFSADGSKAAAVQEDFEHAAALMAGPLAALRAITDDDNHLQPQVAVQNISWHNEGFNVQGWLIGPRAAAPGKKHALIVQVHGGPAAAASPRYISPGEQGSPLIRELVQKGYFIFLPNPRGSFGQGQAFARANRRPARHPDGHRCGGGRRAGRYQPDGPDRPLLRRLHDHVGRDAFAALQGGGCRRRHRKLDLVLRPERHRPVDDPILRRLRLRRPGDLPPAVADRIDQGRPHPDADLCRGTRCRMSAGAVDGILARPEGHGGADLARDL
jgi:hypothetical protein